MEKLSLMKINLKIFRISVARTKNVCRKPLPKRLPRALGVKKSPQKEAPSELAPRKDLQAMCRMERVDQAMSASWLSAISRRSLPDTTLNDPPRVPLPEVRSLVNETMLASSRKHGIRFQQLTRKVLIEAAELYERALIDAATNLVATDEELDPGPCEFLERVQM